MRSQYRARSFARGHQSLLFKTRLVPGMARARNHIVADLSTNRATGPMGPAPRTPARSITPLSCERVVSPCVVSVDGESMSSSKGAPQSELAHGIVKIFVTASVAWMVAVHRGLLTGHRRESARQLQRYDFSAVLGLSLQGNRS